MRLRSSQFAFLLLLVCTVQIRADYASELIARAGYAGVLAVSTTQAEASALRSRVSPAERVRPAPGADRRLDAAERFSQRVVWSVRQPARASAAIYSFTGFLRA